MIHLGRSLIGVSSASIRRTVRNHRSLFKRLNYEEHLEGRKEKERHAVLHRHFHSHMTKNMLTISVIHKIVEANTKTYTQNLETVCLSGGRGRGGALLYHVCRLFL